jgi:hypothetical protein
LDNKHWADSSWIKASAYCFLKQADSTAVLKIKAAVEVKGV